MRIIGAWTVEYVSRFKLVGEKIEGNVSATEPILLFSVGEINRYEISFGV